MSFATPVNMDDPLWRAAIAKAKVGIPHNYLIEYYRDFMADIQATIIARLKQTPAHGTVRPTNPALNDVFLLDGGNDDYTLLLCKSSGVWTDIPLGGTGTGSSAASEWLLGYERVGITDAPQAGQFRPFDVGNRRWEIHLRSGEELTLAVGDKVRFYNSGDNQTLDGELIEANTNVLTGQSLVFSLGTITLGASYAGAATTGWAIAKVVTLPLPGIAIPAAPGTAAANPTGNYASDKHVHPEQNVDVAITAIAILDAIKATRTSADRNKLIGTSPTDENALVFRDLPADDVPPDGVTIETAGGKLQVKDGGISHAKLAADAVETDNIKDGAVGSDALAAGAVTMGKIASNAVSTGKLATGAVTAPKLADGIIQGIPVSKSNSALTLGAQGNVFGLYWGSSGNDVTETTVPAQGYFFGDSDNHPFAAQTALTAAGTKFLTLNHTAWREIAGANTVDFTQNLALAQIGGSVRAEVISSGDVIGWGDFEISGNVVARGTGANLAYRIPITLYDQGQAESGGSPVGNGYDVRITINPNREQLLAKHVRGLIKDILAQNVADLQGDLPIARTSGNLPSARLDASAAVQASDPLADTALMALIVNGILHSASIAHIRKHILPGVNEFASYVLGGGASVGQATLTGSGNQLTLTPNSADETDLQIDIKPNVLIALVRVSNPAEFHLGLVSSTVYQDNLTPNTYTINFVAGEFQTVGSYDFSAGGNAGEAVKVVSYGDRLRQADLVQTVRALAQASHIKIPSEHATRSAIDAGDALAHHDIGLVAELVDSFYEGWTNVSGAHYTTPSDIRDNLPVDAANNDPSVRPTANTPVILREGSAWGGPPNIVWGLNVYGGTGVEYALGISTGGADQYVYRRDGSDWSLLWEDGSYHNTAAMSDPIFMDHWFDVVDGDIRMADSLETRRHQWSIPGISASNMALYRRDGRDVAAMIPNYGGANQIDYSWKRFGVDAVDIGADTTNFGNHLSSADNTVQAALDTLDDLVIPTIPSGNMVSPAAKSWTSVGDNEANYGSVNEFGTGDLLFIEWRGALSSDSGNIVPMSLLRFYDDLASGDSSGDAWYPIRGAVGGQRVLIWATGGQVKVKDSGTNVVSCAVRIRKVN